MKLNLGNQIRINRRRMNLTQEQLAEKFGTSPQAISRWEIGATYPDIEMLPMIASFFETMRSLAAFRYRDMLLLFPTEK